MSIESALFQRVGGFDAGFGERAGEDYELGIRLLKSGATVRYCPGAATEHIDEPTLERSLNRAFQEGRGHVFLGRKHQDAIQSLPLTRSVRYLAAAEKILALSKGGTFETAKATVTLAAKAADSARFRLLWMQLYKLMRGVRYIEGAIYEAGSVPELRHFLHDRSPP